MRHEPWACPKVGDARTSGAGAVPLRSAQMIGQQKKTTQKTGVAHVPYKLTYTSTTRTRTQLTYIRYIWLYSL